MSSSAFEPGDSGGKFQAGDDSQERPAELPDPGLLEEVLRETLSARPQTNCSPAEMKVLLDVAQRYQGHELSLEPVAIDLVESILRFRFHRLKVEPSLWRSVSSSIAETLMEDQYSLERLNAFWRRLAEAIL
jgi:hypothetical protein